MNAQPKLSRFQFLLSLPIDSLVALLGSIICLSFSPIFIRLSELEIGPNATAFNRFWITAVALIVPAFSSLEGWAIFSEPLSFLTLVSFVVILLGIYLAISSTSAIKPRVESANN